MQQIRNWLYEAQITADRYLQKQQQHSAMRSAVNWDTSDAAIQRYLTWCQAHQYDPENKIHFWHYWGIPIPCYGDTYKTGESVTQKSSLELFGPHHISPEQLETHGFTLRHLPKTDLRPNVQDLYDAEIKTVGKEVFRVTAEQIIYSIPTKKPQADQLQEHGGHFASTFSFIFRGGWGISFPFGHRFATQLIIGSNDWEGLRETLQCLYALARNIQMRVRNHEHVRKRAEEIFARFPSKYQHLNKLISAS